MTRCIVCCASESDALTVAKSDCLNMLAYVAHAAAEFARGFGVFVIVLEQMGIRDKHRAAATGVRDYGRIGFAKGVDVLPREIACALEFTRVGVKRAATDLCRGRIDSATVCLQNSRRRLVNSFEEPVRHAPFEEKNPTATWSAYILSAVREHFA